MEQPLIAFTAIYLKSGDGYFGFIEELPGINSYGRSLEDARATLKRLARVVFDEERRAAEEMLVGKDVLREGFLLPLAREA
ncbi:MAG: type II toxin-antitoxin system HicB family antitoxin [Betaproteobacteria bacterium]|nr:MAG: type II toxin-antitoxin system HicB family antitoxin [Betaproteobacteria bacterium]